MRGAADSEIIVIFCSGVCNIWVIVVVAILLLILYR